MLTCGFEKEWCFVNTLVGEMRGRGQLPAHETAVDNDFIGEPDQAAAALTFALTFDRAGPKLGRRYAVVVEQDLWPLTLGSSGKTSRRG